MSRSWWSLSQFSRLAEANLSKVFDVSLIRTATVFPSMLQMYVRFGAHLVLLQHQCVYSAHINCSPCMPWDLSTSCFQATTGTTGDNKTNDTCCRSFWLDSKCLNALLLQYSVALSILFYILIKCAEQQSQSYQWAFSNFSELETSWFRSFHVWQKKQGNSWLPKGFSIHFVNGHCIAAVMKGCHEPYLQGFMSISSSRNIAFIW